MGVRCQGDHLTLRACNFRYGYYGIHILNTGAVLAGDGHNYHIRENHFSKFTEHDIIASGAVGFKVEDIYWERNTHHGGLTTFNLQDYTEDVYASTNRVFGVPTGIYIKNSTVESVVLASDNIINADQTNIYDGGGTNIINELVDEPIRFIDQFKSSTWTHSSGTELNNFQDLMVEVLTMANGRIVNSSSGVFDFYDQDNSNVIFTLVESGLQRVRQ
jgi:hypothetical protein